jgi:hypothetical protein
MSRRALWRVPKAETRKAIKSLSRAAYSASQRSRRSATSANGRGPHADPLGRHIKGDGGGQVAVQRDVVAVAGVGNARHADVLRAVGLGIAERGDVGEQDALCAVVAGVE